jgi:hypothetical protein
MSSTPLTFATTQELFDELAGRFDALMFVGYQDRSEKHYAMVFESKGTAPEIVGLAHMAVRHVNRLVVEGSKD